MADRPVVKVVHRVHSRVPRLPPIGQQGLTFRRYAMEHLWATIAPGRALHLKRPRLTMWAQGAMVLAQPIIVIFRRPLLLSILLLKCRSWHLRVLQ